MLIIYYSLFIWNSYTVVQSLRCVWLFVSPWTATRQAPLSFTISQSLLIYVAHVHWVGEEIQPFHPLSPLLILPSIFPSIRVFSNESALWIRWPKYWSFIYVKFIHGAYLFITWYLVKLKFNQWAIFLFAESGNH